MNSGRSILKNLYGDLPENEKLNADGQNVIDIDMDEIGELVFNAPITDAEILKSERALKYRRQLVLTIYRQDFYTWY